MLYIHSKGGVFMNQNENSRGIERYTIRYTQNGLNKRMMITVTKGEDPKEIGNP